MRNASEAQGMRLPYITIVPSTQRTHCIRLQYLLYPLSHMCSYPNTAQTLSLSYRHAVHAITHDFIYKKHHMAASICAFLTSARDAVATHFTLSIPFLLKTHALQDSCCHTIPLSQSQNCMAGYLIYDHLLQRSPHCITHFLPREDPSGSQGVSKWLPYVLGGGEAKKRAFFYGGKGEVDRRENGRFYLSDAGASHISPGTYH